MDKRRKSPYKRPGGMMPQKNNNKQPNNGWWFWIFVFVILAILFSSQTEKDLPLSPATNRDYTFSDFRKDLVESPEKISQLELVEGTERVLRGKINGETFRLTMPQNDEDTLQRIYSNIDNFEVKTAQTFWGTLLINLTWMLIFLAVIWFFSYRGSQMGNKIWSFGKSRARLSNKNSHVTFKNVAGVDEAKEELEEVIDFLKEPKKFQRLGGKIPKGVLLVGHPGTGKTLLAKAVAGEAGVPFFSLSGSDFVEMFVGVGASRVRDLFEQSRKAAKASGKGAIVFIDEIDAVGRQRFAGIGGGNDEREQTLNALLVEMDGFNPQSGVIIIAATNRPDTLDPALLRPGRFDRQIVVALPDINGREGILRVHTKNIKLGKTVDLRRIAQQTVYFSGADLANACNEAALLAARRNKECVEIDDFLAAVERVTMGPEKKSRTISRKEKEMTAYHEAGHALLSLLLDEVDTFTKVSIIPRGMAGGYTLTPPKEDRHYRNKGELKGTMVVLLGGMVGEEIHMNDTTTGVSNDLEKVAQIARAMVCEYGMSDNLGRMAYGHNQRQHFLGRDLLDHQKNYSEETSKNIDMEVQSLVTEAYQRARHLLREHREKLDLLAKHLIEKEVIDIDAANALMGYPPRHLDADSPVSPDQSKDPNDHKGPQANASDRPTDSPPHDDGPEENPIT